MKCLKIGLVLVVVISLFTGSDSVNVKEVIENIPKEDVTEFIRYYFRLNHETSLQNKDSPLDFYNTLSQWVVQKYGVPKNPNARSMYGGSNVVCFPNGKCINIGDAGIHP